MNNKKIYITPEKIENFEKECIKDEYNLDEAYQSVKKHGFYCCKNYIRGDLLDELIKEYESCFKFNDLPFLKIRNDYRRNIYPKLNYKDFIPYSYNLMNDKNLKSFISKYWKKNFIYPEVITYFKSDFKFPVNNDSVPLHLHMDKQKTLRYFIYLDDVGNDNAPLTVIPGTLNKIKNLRKKYFWRFQNHEEFPNLLKTDQENIYEILAPAGSFIILDTDIAHGAKKILNRKNTRRVIRFDSIEKSNVFKRRFVKYRSLLMNKIFGEIELPTKL